MLDPRAQRDDPPAPGQGSPAQGQDADAPMPGRIRAFVSYSRVNEAEADRLASALEEGGIRSAWTAPTSSLEKTGGNGSLASSWAARCSSSR
jgi:hypothetical protein